jgi:hypothetical protein
VGSAGFNSAFGGSIAIGVTVVLVSARSIFKTSSLSDFINGCSGFISVGVTSSETFALARDAVPILTAAITPRLIKQIRASQTVLIIQFLGIGWPGVAVSLHKQKDRPKAVSLLSASLLVERNIFPHPTSGPKRPKIAMGV